jgi:hypothetical protein
LGGLINSGAGPSFWRAGARLRPRPGRLREPFEYGEFLDLTLGSFRRHLGAPDTQHGGHHGGLGAVAIQNPFDRVAEDLGSSGEGERACD